MSRIKSSLLLFALLPSMLLLQRCGGEEETPKQPSPAEEPTTTGLAYGNENTLLWEISGNGLSTPSYLYGTIHIQDGRVFRYDDAVQQVFDSCDAYAMELLMDEIDPMAQITMIMMEDTTLADLLSPEDFILVKKEVDEKLGIMGMKFNEMKPFFTMSQLTLSEMPRDEDVALDLHFDNMAKQQGKLRIGIEQFEEQMGAVNSITLQEQAEMLVEGITDTTKTDEMLDKMLDAYLTGNLEQMMELTKDTTYPENFVIEFLDKRNVNMADRIDTMVHSQPTFCAVGAGHLGGETGVIALLQAKGYTVRPVNTAFKEEE